MTRMPPALTIPIYGNINDGYLLNDGVHLTKNATDKLAHNLQIKIEVGSQSVCEPRRRKTSDNQNNKRYRRGQDKPAHDDNDLEKGPTEANAKY